MSDEKLHLIAKWRLNASMLEEGHKGEDPGVPVAHALRACADELERITLPLHSVHPPMLSRRGLPPVETTHSCIYTQTKPCRELYTDPDMWCGYCARAMEGVGE
jgi:hypothetical protein